MKYSKYVKMLIKKDILERKPNMDSDSLEKEVNDTFNTILEEALYNSELARLSDDDPLKKKELEESETFMDLHPNAYRHEDIFFPYDYLYHGVRLDDDHSHFASILMDQAIKCGELLKDYCRYGSDNCNEGKFVSLAHYTGDEYDIEFKTFIEENVTFIISPTLNPVKCKYLPFEEWDKIKEKITKTKHRYSYARCEYQYKKEIPFYFVRGILYPYSYYEHVKGYFKTKDDFIFIKGLLSAYGCSYLPIYDPTDHFKDISHLGEEFNRIAIDRSRINITKITK